MGVIGVVAVIVLVLAAAVGILLLIFDAKVALSILGGVAVIAVIWSFLARADPADPATCAAWGDEIAADGIIEAEDAYDEYVDHCLPD